MWVKKVGTNIEMAVEKTDDDMSENDGQYDFIESSNSTSTFPTGQGKVKYTKMKENPDSGDEILGKTEEEVKN